MPADVTLNSGSGGAIIATDPTTSSEHYQLIKLAQGAVGTFTLVTTANALPVVVGSSFQGGIVSLSSQIAVTATSATNPWSSAPGFNVPVVTVSSGLVQISGTPLVNVVGTSSGVAVVTTSGGLVVQATGPFGTVTVLSASSGLVQVSGVPLIAVTSSVMSLVTIGTTSPASVLVTSSGGPVVSMGVNTAAGYGPVTSSAGQLGSLSSGTVTLSSVHTVTATAGTNPWSSAPGFNVPVVSVSSGLVQISGVPPIIVTTSAFSGVSVVTTAMIAVLVTSSGGPVVSAGVNTAAGYGPVTSSAGRLSSLSSGTVTLSSVHTVTATAGTNPWSSAPGFNVPVVNVSSGAVQSIGVVAASSGIPAGLAFANNITSGGVTLSVNIKGTPGLWFGYTIYNSTAALRSIKIFNTTSAPTVGSTTNIVSYLPVPGSTGGGGANAIFPYGVFCSNGIGYTVSAGVAATDATAPGVNDVSLTLYYV